jgi:hypothetical protein
MDLGTVGTFPAGEPGQLGDGRMDLHTERPAHLPLGKRGLEFDNFVGFDIYTQITTIRYKSGTMFHWDGMVIQYFSKRGFGAVGSNLTQITNDTGPVADVRHGFEGRAWGVGPMALYVAKVEKPGVVVQLRWINEFEVKNLLKGNAFMFGVSLKLN